MLSKKQMCFFFILNKSCFKPTNERADRQILLLELTALRTLVRSSNHLRYIGGPKLPPLTFFVLANLGRFDLGTSLSEQVAFWSKDNAGS